MMNDYGELELVQKPAIELFQTLGWEALNCEHETYGEDGTLGRETRREVVLTKKLKVALAKLNPDVPQEALERVITQFTEDRTVQHPIEANKEIYQFLKEGMPVSFRASDGTMKDARVRFIDWENTSNNDYFVAAEFWVSGDLGKKRPDMVGFINGIPLVVIELKAIHVNVKKGYDENISDYKTTIPQLFWYNAFIIVSNGLESRLGTLSSKWEHFNEWPKSASENDSRASKEVALETIIRGTCSKENLSDLVENFIVYTETSGSPVKMVSKNHQYLGVNNAVQALKEIETRDGKLGVFWHTQGSGKSLSMIFFCQKVLRKVPGDWTFVIVTDRQELDTQIYRSFAAADVITETHTQADSSRHLRELLGENHRFVFTLIHKFREEPGKVHPVLSERSNIIVITDESHRSQYDMLAENMRNALPNASFLAFTGTPLISGQEERTREVFGDYISIYNFRQSVEDGATVPLYYENRMPELQLTNESLTTDIYEAMEEADLDDEQRDRVERLLGRNYHIITRKERLDAISSDLVQHFMTRGHKGKAMVVSVDKATALRMHDYVQVHWESYKKELETKKAAASDPFEKAALERDISYMEETEMAVVVSSAQNEIEDMKKLGLDIEPHRRRMVREDLGENFKKDEHPFRIVFVCAMWMTGFDVPSCSTIYMDKPMKGHTLMQAIARANRVYADKSGGVIVDYVGVFKNLEEALAIYGEGTSGAIDSPIVDKGQLIDTLSLSITKAEEYCSDLGIDFDAVLESSGLERIRILQESANKLLSNDETKKNYLTLASDVNKIFKAILPDTKVNPFIPRRSIIRELERMVRKNTDPVDISEFLQDIETLLDRSIATEPFVIDAEGISESNIVDLSGVDFDALAEKFRSGLENIAVDELRAAIDRTLDKVVETNKSRIDFRLKFQKLIDEYNQGSRNAEDLLEQLMVLAGELKEEEKRHIKENISEEELAIFDIITRPNKNLTDDESKQVKRVAKQMLNTLHAERLVLDWKKKENARSAVKVTILDSLWGTSQFEGLPQNKFTDSDCDSKAEEIFDHVFDSYLGQGKSVYTR